MHEEFLACSEEHPADIPQADLDEMNKMLRDAHERDAAEQSEQFQASQDSGGENCRDYFITNADENKSDKPIQQFENLPDNNSVEGNKTDAPIQGTLDSNIGTSRNKRKKKDEISDEEYQQLTANDIAESKRRLSELPSVDRRGLNDETFQHLGFGFLPNWKHPKCQNSIPTPRFIARLGNTNDPPAYNAIMTPSGRERFKNSKLWEADKCLTAVAKLVFHPSALTASLVAITEGEIDAASIWQCLKRGKIIDAGTCSGVDVCALGGTDAGVTDLIKRLETMDRKPLIVILFDGDDTGRTDKLKPGRERAEELRKQLWAIGVVAVCEFFEDVLSDDEKKEVGDKPDANQILQAKGDDYLYWRFARIVKKARDDFKQAEEEMKRWREHEQEQSSRNAGDDIQPSTQNNQSEKKASYDPEIQKLIDEINDTITCEMLEQKGIIEHSKRGKARPRGYVCLYCGSGTKKEKTGVLNFSETLPLRFKCLACGKTGNVLTLLSKVWSIPRKGKEFFDLLRKTADEFGIHYDPKIFNATRRKSQRADWIDSLFMGDTTDMDFADRLEKFCGNKIRWLTDDKTWLLYEQNKHGGGLWQNAGDQNSCLLPCVREMANVMSEHAETKAERELVKKMKLTRHALSSITMLKSVESILITSADLNQHTELVNCLNGVVDLQSGKLMIADPKIFLMTQTVNAVFGEPIKENLQFIQNFFAQIMPDEMTRSGLLRWLGYNLTGETNADKFMVWIGESGANGKGCLGRTMLELMNGYGVGLAPRALLKSNKPADADKATTGLNGLVGKHFALSEEMPLDGELDSSLMKTLAGGDKINLRLNYKEFRTLINKAKINISGNYTPRLENTKDGGIRRRLLNMPFTVTFGTDENPADPNLKKKLLLQDNLNALFAILVREAKKFYEHGLIISDLMTQATTKHLDDSDFVADFLSEHFTFGADLSVKVKELIDELKAAYPAECRAFRKRADLINRVAQADDITLDYDSHENQKVFKGIGKPQPKKQQGDSNGFSGEPILSSDDYPPFD